MRDRLVISITTLSLFLCGCSGQTMNRLSNESLFDVMSKKPPKENERVVTSKENSLKPESKPEKLSNNQEVRGFLFGEDYSLKSKDLVFLRNEPNYKIYNYKKDNNKAGNINLNSVEYAYHDGKLASITIYFKGIYNFGIIKDSLDKKYGEPYQRNRYIEEYLYSPNDDLSIYVKYNEISEIGIAYYSDQKIGKEIIESDNSQAENSKTGLW